MQTAPGSADVILQVKKKFSMWSREYYLVLVLIVLNGCPMDVGDSNLRVMNNSGREIGAFIKDSLNNVLTFDFVKPNSLKPITLINRWWDDIIPHPRDYITMLFVDAAWWYRTRDLSKLTDNNVLKKIMLRRSSLDSLKWVIEYRE